jgi:hypothetical protein
VLISYRGKLYNDGQGRSSIFGEFSDEIFLGAAAANDRIVMRSSAGVHDGVVS